MENIKMMQQKSLEMALYFVDFCEKNNLLCYLCGGGAIGAIRHRGFIPWDDDLDFFMPRADYERLQVLWPQLADRRYFLSNSNETYLDRNLFVTIRDVTTTCIKPYQQDLDIPHGFALDILPLDYHPADPKERKKQIMWAMIYSLYKAQTIPEKHGFLMKWGSKILLAITPKKYRYKIWKTAEKNMSKYMRMESDGITELCSGPYYMRKKYPMIAFDRKEYFDFEYAKLPLPKGYDIYLRTAFGNYMQLPPVEKQVPHHDVVVLDLANSYTKYRGTYYGK